MRLHLPALSLMALTLSLNLGAIAQAPPPPASTQAQANVRVLEGVTFGVWAPELHELFVRVPLQALPAGDKDEFVPTGVFIDGTQARYAYWYFDGSTYDYGPIRQAGGKKIEVFIPLAWRAGQKYNLRLTYQYAGQAGEQTLTAAAPAQGGVWSQSKGHNYAFEVREEAGLDRRQELVEFDLTVTADQFPDPQANLRATLAGKDGTWNPIPCQVYAVDRINEPSPYSRELMIRLRAVVELSLQARQKALVVLWDCPASPRAPEAADITLTGSALGGVVENPFYRIELDPQSGQLLTWWDKAMNLKFGYLEKRTDPPHWHTMSYTPDLYKAGASWSHAGDWKQPQSLELRGPLFVQTMRQGPMPDVPEVQARVTYRFFAHRPEVRSSSAMHVVKDVVALAFRNGGMIQSADLFTHAAWPRQDGSIVRMPLGKLLGNDTGSPPPGRMPWNTPWVAFYHQDKKLGLALLTANQSYFNLGMSEPNMSNAMYYVSLYRGAFLYTLRALNITYSANIRSYHSRLEAGTVAYEEMAILPFTFKHEDNRQFETVERLQQEILKPLVITP